ncbi:hypothetical protein CLOM_g2810 [Closterium sp. NIES-68]|nr:hypothetical protein CLOM_g16685 [Closterium sp. NIES-68]GJP43334.1 hypothetical protein CLOM_g2810 [Closterium sp. NIES-68]GJP82805.1 hypothetical protein CLOP_g13034 [Closterium sp. NIES-67]
MTRELATIITAAAALVGTGLGLLLSRTVLKPKLSKSTIKHVVLTKFKADRTAEQIQELIDGYRALTEKIPAMKGFEWGGDVSVEGFQKGYTHVFVSTFDDVAGRDAYLVHEAHKEYAAVLFEGLEDAIVLDYVPTVALSRFYS